jgi:anti-sigma regulatory factor (Ser/Thr protein kinase)
VTANPIACVRLPPSLESVPAARSCTTAALRAWGLTSALLDDVALLLTELTANAIRHAHGIVGVEIDLNGDRLTVRVCDEDDTQPRIGEPSADDEGGRGLWLVDAIADRWGWEPGAPGKVVWFELTTPVPPGCMSSEPAVA